MKNGIEKVVNWWSEQISCHGMNWNNGDDSPQGGMMFAMANMLAMETRNKVSEAQYDKFKTKLTEMLTENPKMDLSVDYGPSMGLSEALNFAGINPAVCPCKSHSRIDANGDAFARCGYGKSEQKL